MAVKERSFQYILPGLQESIGVDKGVARVETSPDGDPRCRLSFGLGPLYGYVYTDRDWRNVRNPFKKAVRITGHIVDQLI